MMMGARIRPSGKSLPLRADVVADEEEKDEKGEKEEEEHNAEDDGDDKNQNIASYGLQKQILQ